VFENVLGQEATGRLIGDIEAGVLAPAMLFSGPPASGKGTAALELGRVISCEGAESSPGKKASWNCGCPACSRHRLLIHPDLLCLGKKSFSAEIAAAAAAFTRETANAPARILFIRSARKLLARFNPALWEDEPKGSKISPLVNSLEEDLDELEAAASVPGSAGQGSAEQSTLGKLAERIVKSAFKLESEGISETIPIAQIRRAAFWGRLAPAGKGKLLVIENADRMQDEAKNSLLKLLEEPPPRLTLAITTSRPGSLLPTILSRLRPYRFTSRSAASEEEVIRRVYRDASGAKRFERAMGSRIAAYLDSFLPVSGDTLDKLAAFFASSAAYKAALVLKGNGRPLPEEVVLLGKYCSAKAEAGFGKNRGDPLQVVSLILEKAENFELRSLFSAFLCRLLELVSLSQRNGALAASVPDPVFYDTWKTCADWAENAVAVYNLRPAQALEKMFTDLSRGLSRGMGAL